MKNRLVIGILCLVGVFKVSYAQEQQPGRQERVEAQYSLGLNR